MNHRHVIQTAPLRVAALCMPRPRRAHCAHFFALFPSRMDLTQWSGSGLLVVENHTMARSEHIPTSSERQPPIQEHAPTCPRCGHELGETALRAAVGQVRDETPATGHQLDLAPPRIRDATVSNLHTETAEIPIAQAEWKSIAEEYSDDIVGLLKVGVKSRRRGRKGPRAAASGESQPVSDADAAIVLARIIQSARA